MTRGAAGKAPLRYTPLATQPTLGCQGRTIKDSGSGIAARSLASGPNPRLEAKAAKKAPSDSTEAILADGFSPEFVIHLTGLTSNYHFCFKASITNPPRDFVYIKDIEFSSSRYAAPKSSAW